MRIKGFLLALLVCCATGIYAQNSSDSEFNAEVMRSFELQHTRATLQETILMQYKQPQNRAVFSMLTDQQLEDMASEVVDLMVPKLQTKMFELYRQYLTLEELRQINDYLASPVGQKATKLVPLFTNEGTKIAQDPEVQAGIMEIVQRYILNTSN